MSRISGSQFKGIMRDVRADKRKEAQERQSQVKPERTRAYRREQEKIK